ncbi:MAG: SWIM zinc finger family protein, partial [Thermoanaerobaculia bacterium]
MPDIPWWLRERPAKRIAVKDGIKARSKRGAFATQWWAKRWISVLEGFNLGARLQRGRSYAR